MTRLRAELHAITARTGAVVPAYAEPVARAATPAIAALLAADVPHEVLQYHHDPRNESFGEEAVSELAQVEGVDPGQVFKTLVIALPRGLAVAVIPVPSKLSLKAAAAALGVPKATMAERAVAERSTGYVIGGISPFGQRRPLPTVVGLRRAERDRARLPWRDPRHETRRQRPLTADAA